MADYAQYLRESGQQGTLDAFGPGEFEKAASAWASGGGGGGGGGVDFSSIPSAMDFAKQLGTGEEAVMNKLISTMGGQEKPLDIYGRLETEAGVPELRTASKSLSKEIASIEDYLDIIEPNVSARTRESLVTEAQRSGMVAKEKEPYQEKLTKLGTGLGRVRQSLSETIAGIGTKTGLALQGQQMELEPLKMQYTALVDRNARTMTGFTIDRQTELDILFDKYERERQLSDMEWQRANEISSEEREYRRTLETTAAESGTQFTGNESNDELLALIGNAAAEEIAWDRRDKGGTAGDKARDAELLRLQKEARGGMGYEDNYRRYTQGGKLTPSEIREAWSDATQSTPAATAEQEYGWGEGGDPEGTDYQTMRGLVDQAKRGNESLSDIKDMIASKGFSASDFSDQLSGYSPGEKEKKWPFNLFQ